MHLFVGLVIGSVVGAGATWSLLLHGATLGESVADVIVRMLLPIVGVFGAALALTLPIIWWSVNRFLRRARGTLDQVVKEASSAHMRLCERTVQLLFRMLNSWCSRSLPGMARLRPIGGL